MKKNLASPAGLLLFAGMISCSFVLAQNKDYANNDLSGNRLGAFVASSSGGALTANNTLAFLEARLAKKFNRNFPEASEATWYKDGNQTRFYFHSGGAVVRTTMNKGGELAYVIRYYDASKLPKNLDRQIKNMYKGYKLTNVTEVNVSDARAYIVTLDGLEDWLQVKCIEGDIEEYAHYTH